MMDQRCAPSLFLHFEQVPPFVRAQLEESYGFRKKHDWRQAAGRALGAREYCKEAGAPVGVAVAQIHLADCYREVGELGRSIEQCEEAYQILRRQPSRAQRHNEAVAIYLLGILYELQLFSDDMRVLNLYHKASEQFRAAQEYWATCNARSLIDTCQRAQRCLEGLTNRVVNRCTSPHSEQANFAVCQRDSKTIPFARQGLGYIVDDAHIEIDGTTYRLHVGALPKEIDGGEADENHYFYFAVLVPENQWAFPEAEVNDYVLIRQRWFVDEEKEGILGPPGLLWEPGSGWVLVNFRRESDGNIQFHYSPYIIGGPNKLKGFIVALVKPEDQSVF
jgi:tetratricopeptide (TPR) repeat protein